jgi:hypothetical protein
MSEGLQSVAHPECSYAVALQATVVHLLFHLVVVRNVAGGGLQLAAPPQKAALPPLNRLHTSH